MRFQQSEGTPPHMNRWLQLKMLGAIAIVATLLFGVQFFNPPAIRTGINPDQLDYRPIFDNERPRAATEIDQAPAIEAPPVGFDQPQVPVDSLARLDKQLLSTVQDDMIGIRRTESHAFYYMLDFARRMPAGDLERHGRRDVLFVNLMMDPGIYRGEPITIIGEMRRLSPLTAPTNSFGITRLYEAWIFTSDSGNHPYRVVCSEIPPGWETALANRRGDAPELQTMVQVTGFFFKKEGYQSQGGFSKAPLLLARRLERYAAPTTVPTTNELTPWLMGIVIAVGLSMLVTLIAYNLSDRRARERELRRFREHTAADLEGLRQLGESPATRQPSRVAPIVPSAGMLLGEWPSPSSDELAAIPVPPRDIGPRTEVWQLQAPIHSPAETVETFRPTTAVRTVVERCAVAHPASLQSRSRSERLRNLSETLRWSLNTLDSSARQLTSRLGRVRSIHRPVRSRRAGALRTRLGWLAEDAETTFSFLAPPRHRERQPVAPLATRTYEREVIAAPPPGTAALTGESMMDRVDRALGLDGHHREVMHSLRQTADAHLESRSNHLPSPPHHSGTVIPAPSPLVHDVAALRSALERPLTSFDGPRSVPATLVVPPVVHPETYSSTVPVVPTSPFLHESMRERAEVTAEFLDRHYSQARVTDVIPSHSPPLGGSLPAPAITPNPVHPLSEHSHSTRVEIHHPHAPVEPVQPPESAPYDPHRSSHETSHSPHERIVHEHDRGDYEFADDVEDELEDDDIGYDEEGDAEFDSGDEYDSDPSEIASDDDGDSRSRRPRRGWGRSRRDNQDSSSDNQAYFQRRRRRRRQN